VAADRQPAGAGPAGDALPAAPRTSGETRLELIAEAIPGFFYEHDHASGRTACGAGFSEMLGYTEAEATHDTDWWRTRIHPDDLPRLEAAGLDPHGAGYRCEYRVRRADGSWCYVADHGRHVRDETGTLVRTVGVTTDITQRHDAELTRRQLYLAAEEARALAERANAAKTRFLATMSHELRTPLNAIAGYAELLQMEIAGPLTEQQATWVSRVREAEHTLVRLIDGLLDLARIESGHTDFRIGPVRIDLVIRAVEDLVAPQLATRALLWHCDLPDASLVARGDEEKVERVLVNLVTNAIKYSPHGGRIALRAAPQDDVIVVQVRDSGPGIPDDQFEVIFEPFVRLGAPREGDQPPGTGLGLAICRQFARGMGGDVTVRNVEGGAEFTLVLPREGSQAPDGN
jgi:PAS domain S-box-containing protein